MRPKKKIRGGVKGEPEFIYIYIYTSIYLYIYLYIYIYIYIFRGFCTRINTILCTHTPCLGTSPLPVIAHTIGQIYSSPPTPLYCNIYHTILVVTISCKGQTLLTLPPVVFLVLASQHAVILHAVNGGRPRHRPHYWAIYCSPPTPHIPYTIARPNPCSSSPLYDSLFLPRSMR